MAGAAIVLNVDRNEAGRYVTTKILRKAGYEVLEASTGAQAMALVQEPPDAVLLHIDLPDMRGFDVCDRLRSQPRTAGIPVVYLTASARDRDSEREALRQPLTWYLREPLRPEKLLATMAEALAVWRRG